MKTSEKIPVANLIIDPDNMRTMSQENEQLSILSILQQEKGVDHMIDMGESISQNGLSSINRFLVLKKDGRFILKEGNRRITCIKFLLGLATIPPEYNALKSKFEDYKRQAEQNNILSGLNTIDAVVCTDEAEIQREIDLRHGLAQGGAGFVPWSAMAKARNDLKKGVENHPLILAENYINDEYGNAPEIRTRLLGNFPLTTLIRYYAALCRSLGSTAAALPSSYMGHSRKAEIKNFLKAIENKTIDSRPEVDVDTVVAPFFPQQLPPAASQSLSLQPNAVGQYSQGANAQGIQQSSRTASTIPLGTWHRRRPRMAIPLTDPRSVKKELKFITPTYSGSSKIEALARDLRKLNMERTPIIYCMGLRSLFELSVNQYMKRKSIPLRYNGSDKELKQRVSDCVADLIIAGSIPAPLNRIMTVLNGPIGNQKSLKALHEVVHSENSMLTKEEICASFHHMLPLLKKLNDIT